MENKKVLIFATSNNNKIIEANKLLKSATPYIIISKEDAGIPDDIPETGTTIEENAIQKANYIYVNFKKNCFAEDTGLIIDALNGEPGIYSGRYAGEDKDDKKKYRKSTK
jgi:XTP/dITP diphosphohydrolase